MDRIRSVEAIELAVPSDNSGGDRSIMPSGWDKLDFVLVRAEDEAGVVGWGECFAYFCREPVAAAVRTMIAPLAVGRRIDDIAAWNRECQHTLHLFGRGGLAMYALSGVDMALWDLKARKAGKPLAEVLKPGHRFETAEAYASLLRFDSPAGVTAGVRAVVERGFRKIKIHEVETATIEAGLAGLDEQSRLMIDANCQWSPAQWEALRPLLAHDKVIWVEEPFFPPEDYRSLAEGGQSGIKLACGENARTVFEFEQLLASVPYAQPDIMKVGGISALLEIIAAAEKSGSTIMPHGAALGPGYFAVLHLFPLLKPDSLVEYFWIETIVPVGKNMPRPRNGRVGMPKGAGIGFEPSDGLIAAYRV